MDSRGSKELAKEYYETAVSNLSAAKGVFNINPVIAYFVSLISGLFTAIVEAISPHGLDNFTVQLSSALPPYLITLILS